MRVILADDVVGVGDVGSTVKVKPGFARNFLIPRGLAFECEGASARMLAHRMRQIEAKKRRMKGDAEKQAQRVREAELVFTLRVGSGGKVFGSIGAKDIAAALGEKGLEVDRRRVQLHDAIRKIGTHFVTVKLHPEVQAQAKIVIKSVAATKAEEEAETASAKQSIEEQAQAREAASESAEEGDTGQ